MTQWHESINVLLLHLATHICSVCPSPNCYSQVYPCSICFKQAWQGGSRACLCSNLGQICHFPHHIFSVTPDIYLYTSNIHSHPSCKVTAFKLTITSHIFPLFYSNSESNSKISPSTLTCTCWHSWSEYSDTGLRPWCS